MTAFGADGEYILWTAETGQLVQEDFLLELDMTGGYHRTQGFVPPKAILGASVAELHYHKPQELYQRH